MLELLQHVFGCLCGQDPAHTWAPGGVLLPFCQRCTGLYVGACVAAALHLRFRPAPRPRWLWLNGGFLLFMVPFGFHWLPQGPVLRAATGVLFGFGLVAYCALPFGKAAGPLPCPSVGMGSARFAGSRAPLVYLAYAAGLVLTMVLVPWLGASGGWLAANALAAVAALGALALFGLAAANAAIALWRLIQAVGRTGLRERGPRHQEAPAAGRDC
jgi:hypothetical protein